LIEIAYELQVSTITAAEIHSLSLDAVHNQFNKIIQSAANIYLSICMDVFAAPFAPGVSAPQPSGLTPWQVIPLLQRTKQSGKLLSIEIAETSPPLDHQGLTSRLAAEIIYYLV
jgi:formiminoglutamase